MKDHNKKQLKTIMRWVAAYISVLLLFSATYVMYRYWQESKVIIANIESENVYVAPEITVSAPAQTITAALPEAYNIIVPYAGQAPFSNWTVHEESCEEAAIYMYYGYLQGTNYPNGRVPEAEADTVYRAMKQWQVTNYGSEPDLTMTALGAFAKSYYGLTPTVKKDITEKDIKTAIAAGHPVVVPVMTHSLQNSMYGPETTYHVLMIKGYDATGVFANDAGVGNGPNHHYDWNILWQAIDAQKEKMNQAREMLYLTK